MNKLALKIGAASSAVIAAGLLLAPVALAQTCTITDNGAVSTNHCRIRITTTNTTVQTNTAHVTNNVTVVSNTGGNKASFNTGGDSTITSGDSTVTVTVTNTLNSNSITP